MKRNLLSLSLLIILVGCTSQVREINRMNDSVEYYEDLFYQQKRLSVDAEQGGQYTEMVIHQSYADAARLNAHRFKDSLFNLRNIKP